MNILVPEGSPAAMAAQQRQVRLMNIIGLAAQIFSQTLAHSRGGITDVSKVAAQALVDAGTFWIVAESFEQANAEPESKPLVTP